MVVFVDFDDDATEPPDRYRQQKLEHVDWRLLHRSNMHGSQSQALEEKDKNDERLNPNLNAMTEAFGCYPIIIEIAALLDLNSLDSLSLTCRQIRSNLLQFRTQLMAHTLRCSNEKLIPDPEHTMRFRARAADWYFVEPDGSGRSAASGAGKVGHCARDWVGDCRKCGRVVCRNCTIKPPAPILLKNRHRRLCPTCVRAPIASLLCAPSHSGKSLPTYSSSSTPTPTRPPTPPADIPLNILQTIPSYCTCPTSTYLCTPCGRTLRSADADYDNIWRWRTRYGGSGIGGLGTGMGEGNRSFECGRGGGCERAKWVEEERDCDAEDAREMVGLRFAGSRNGSVDESAGSAASSLSSSYGSERSQTPGYLRHEIEGIGGVVKKKLVRMVRVGACVTEWEDEKERGTYLVREAEGRCRSWCGWCHRVVLGEKDAEHLGLDVRR